jgi:hypothetical protein
MNYFERERRRLQRGEFYGQLIAIAIVVGILLLFFGAGIVRACDSTKTNLVKNCRVLQLEQQQLIYENGTHIRYLVVTDKETFVCESSILNSKYDNSDIFWRLKKDSIYDFTVAGGGKSLITDYRNILDYNSAGKNKKQK